MGTVYPCPKFVGVGFTLTQKVYPTQKISPPKSATGRVAPTKNH